MTCSFANIGINQRPAAGAVPIVERPVKAELSMNRAAGSTNVTPGRRRIYKGEYI